MGVTQDVQVFHRKHGFDEGVDLTQMHFEDDKYSEELRNVGAHVKFLSERFEWGTPDGMRPGKSPRDPRLQRAHLMLEELGELMIAMAVRGEVSTLDGLADLSYVVHGTAVCFDLPIDAAHDEVQRSNMSKEPGSGVPSGMHTKGETFSPPDLAAVLRQHRRQQR